MATGAQIEPSELASTVAFLPLTSSVEASRVPPHRISLVPLFLAVQVRPSGEDTSVPPDPAATTRPGRAATARSPALDMPDAALQTRPSELERIVPASPTTTQRVPVQTTPRGAWRTGVG